MTLEEKTSELEHSIWQLIDYEYETRRDEDKLLIEEQISQMASQYHSLCGRYFIYRLIKPSIEILN